MLVNFKSFFYNSKCFISPNEEQNKNRNNTQEHQQKLKEIKNQKKQQNHLLLKYDETKQLAFSKYIAPPPPNLHATKYD